MWYVIQTESGRESYIKRLIEVYADASTYDEVFIPQRQMLKRVAGQWRPCLQPLIPGYLFVITTHVEQLAHELRGVPAFTKLLGNENLFTPLATDEAALIDNFTANEHRIVLASQAVVEGDRVKVLKGPLVGQEGLITKINRHRRTADLQMQVMGRTKRITLALEVLHKRP